MSRPLRWPLVVAATAALALAGCSLVEGAKARLWPTPTTASPTAVTITQGQVRDAITKLPVAGVQLQARSVTALTDVEGGFSVPSLSEDVITVTAPGYEPVQIRPRPGFPLMVDLVPDPSTTFRIIYGLERQHEFAREYDLLHPDVQVLFSREEFVLYMEQNRPYDIVDVSVGATDVLVSGIVLGKVYEDVAQVQVQASVRIGNETIRRGWQGYAAKADGLWRWFRGPLVWPTPIPAQ